MIVTAIGLVVFFITQVILGLIMIFQRPVTDRMLIGLVMLYVWLAGFVIGSILA